MFKLTFIYIYYQLIEFYRKIILLIKTRNLIICNGKNLKDYFLVLNNSVKRSLFEDSQMILLFA